MNRRLTLIIVLPLLCRTAPAQSVSLDRTGTAVWQPIALTVDGPDAKQDSDPNPFRNYRLTITFENGGYRTVAPGYFNGDGQWRAHLLPNRPGIWTYHINFRSGPDIALSEDMNAGEPLATDGFKGTFTIVVDEDQPAPGLLRYVDGRYLQFAGNGRYFLKAGADSPENFLAYAGFVNTRPTHQYTQHMRDYPHDIRWPGSEQVTIFGTVSYLASVGVNSVYMITMNVGGDGKDVWPWVKPDVRDRFDCRKLDQWSAVFDYMNAKGIALHILTQETENDQLLDNGELGPLRKLYYRELIARFAHHPMLFWNLGEENTNTTAQQKAFAAYIRRLDPCDHPIVIHTYPSQKQKVYEPLLGFEHLDGPSLQVGDMKHVHAQTLEWIRRSDQAGRPWVVCLDEIGPANTGVKPDADDPDHDDVRRYALWGNLMAGGAGVEWYFGYKYPHNDLNCEDFRSRQNMWKQTKIAVDFFHEHLPFSQMQSHDELTAADDDYCFARPGEVYAAYLPPKRRTTLTLTEGEYTVRWFNPQRGGPLLHGTVRTLSGPGDKALGAPPERPDRDWVVLVRRERP